MANSKERDLAGAKKAKKDEFYTRLEDIALEMKNYREYFSGKTVLCNCDDPYESNFFKYFAMNFNYLGLKKLICTCYAGSPIIYTQLSLFGDEVQVAEYSNKKPYKIEITEISDLNGDGAVDLTDVNLLLRSADGKPQLLHGNGDFRSQECIDLLKQADVVVTNPPFSLFREYVAQLIEYEKKFIIIGSVNALSYKEIFSLIRDNKVWLGQSIHSGDREFRVPDDYPISAAGFRIDENGVKYIRVKGVRWYTNLDYKERHDRLITYKEYNKKEYPTYYKYDAINVDVTKEIPGDYFGVMGVPITFMDKYCPEQFEILGLGITESGLSLGIGVDLTEDEMRRFKKDSPAFRRGTLFYLDENGKAKVPYARILIRRRTHGN